MATFKIEIDPAMPESAQVAPMSLEDIDAGNVLDHHPEQYDIIYHLDGRSFRYYSADILTILNDLHQEWELVRSRTPHLMTLSGYTVLEITFEGESAVFLDPVDGLANEKKRIGDPIWVVAVEEAFHSATEQVLSVIRGIGEALTRQKQ